MKLQQLRYLCAVANQNLNLSKAAKGLHISQPGISKQIQLLEDELGVEIFIRNGKRITSITPPGQSIVEIARKILREENNLKNVSQEFTNKDIGSLTVATTHTQARYALPQTIREFTNRYPKIKLKIRQGNPIQISKLVTSGQADIAIATEAIEFFNELVMLPCYQWNRCIITPPNHPLLSHEQVSLKSVVKYPIITYDFAFTGRSKINQAFEAENLTPNVVLTALDADVIKTYVELGLGIGIVAQMAFNPNRDKNLRSIEAGHLFEPSTTRIGIRKNSYLRSYIFDFIHMFSPQLSKNTVKKAMNK
ncbi:MAG: HTH-type transcriptional regulator CysB [Nitrosomonadaceae bacterium]|nr:HTH-type transcriptional regulator CysB [Nitrosomonadaceae bacterium]|tara:strand:+ start:3286 stop:4206 length:921 start_codon:yes stop_codon:yes gene_type:complete